MPRAQNSRKGRYQFAHLTAGTAVITTGTVTTLTPTTLDLAGKLALSANSTGITSTDYEAALPGNVDSNVFIGLLYNSTGRAAFINSTGTTHKYLLTTSKQPT